jgi:hypothetical protein
MKYKLILSALLFISCDLSAQNLTGIWRGYFYADIGPYKEYYKYEVQINELRNASLQGVTYSYRTTVFYGKATFDGIWFPKTQSMILKELKLVELKIQGNSEACAMTCSLDYTKDGKTEMLKGTFTSINTSSKQDCGSGTVYLERVQESDFHKEDFLLKKSVEPAPPVANNTKPKTTPPLNNDVSKANAKRLQTALGIPADGVAGPKTLAAVKQKAPGFTEKLDLSNTNQVNRLIDQIKKNNVAVIKKPAPGNNSSQNKTQPPPVIKKDTIVKTTPVQTPSGQTEIKTLPAKKIIPVPDVIKTRSNPLVKTIITNFADIKIELYDNGEIDGDTITVYHNNEVIAWKKGLTDKPITISLKADANNTTHEFVMVADNLGTIAPNTALMIITTGGKRYQLFIASDKQKNAKVIVQYNPSVQ